MQLLSEEHFTVDGTLIQAWASTGAASRRSRSAGIRGQAGRGWQRCCCATRWSRPPIRRRGCIGRRTAEKAIASYQGHALMENRNGLVVAAKASQAATVTERETAAELLDGLLGPKDQRGERKITLGADTQYQETDSCRRSGIAGWRRMSANMRREPRQKRSDRQRTER